MQIHKRHFAEIIAEFLGTFVLVAVILMSSLIAPSASGFTIGFVLAALIMGLGTFTMAHFNPIVTLGNFFSNAITNKKITKQNVIRLVVYMIVQLVASAAAVFLSMWVAAELVDFLGEVTLGNTLIANPSGETSLVALGFVLEGLFSFIFVTTVLVSIQNKNMRSWAGLPIGLMLLVLTMLGSGITGASFHPFRSLVAALVEQGESLDILWLYLLAPTTGGSLAGLLVGIMNLLRNAPDSEKKEKTVKQTTKSGSKSKSKSTRKRKSSKSTKKSSKKN